MRDVVSAQTLLSASELVVDRGARKVLRGIDFSLCSGEVVGLLGVNGSGKSTLLESLQVCTLCQRVRFSEVKGIENIIRDSEGQRRNISGFGLCLQGRNVW